MQMTWTDLVVSVTAIFCSAMYVKFTNSQDEITDLFIWNP